LERGEFTSFNSNRDRHRDYLSNVFGLKMESGRVNLINLGDLDEFLKHPVVLLDIWAPWCGWCRRISPIIDEVAGEMGKAVAVAKMNLDHNEDIKQRFDFMTIPALFFLKNGEVIKQTGSIPKEEILETLKGMLNS